MIFVPKINNRNGEISITFTSPSNQINKTIFVDVPFLSCARGLTILPQIGTSKFKQVKGVEERMLKGKHLKWCIYTGLLHQGPSTWV